MGHIKIWSVFEAALRGFVVQFKWVDGGLRGRQGRKEVDPAKRETTVSHLTLQPRSYYVRVLSWVSLSYDGLPLNGCKRMEEG